MSIVTLATDLDGTLIPLNGSSKSLDALSKIDKRHKQNDELMLIFVTGRHLSSILDLYDQFPLPTPDLIIGDVGTSIYRYADKSWIPVKRYSRHLKMLTDNQNRDIVVKSLSKISGLDLQEEEKQGEFKISYYVDVDMLSSIVQKIEDIFLIKNMPFNIVHSLDPFTGKGLIDILPKEVTKMYAIKWLIKENIVPASTLIYAGDSGNDREVFLSEIKSIVVNNAPGDLKREIKEKRFDLNNVLFTQSKSVEGVLEGCDFFGWK